MFSVHFDRASIIDVQLICLDIDGTLLDHAGASAAAISEFARAHDVESSDPVALWLQLEKKYFPLFEARSCSFVEQQRMRMARFLHKSLTPSQADSLFQEYLELYEKNWMAYPDVMDLSATLNASVIPVAILTNGYKSQQSRKLARIGWRIPSLICASSEMPYSKPEPAFYQEAARIARVDPARCLMIGNDVIKDVDAAMVAGFNAVHLNRTSQPSRIPSITSLAQLYITEGL